MRRTGWLTVVGAAAAATYVAARAGAPRRPSRRGTAGPTDPDAADQAPPAASDSASGAPAEPPAATRRRGEDPTGAVTIVPVAMETSALEPRLPERNGSPALPVSGNGTAIARPRVRGPLELPPPKRPTAGTLAGLALLAALAALALGAAGIALWAQDDDGADAAVSAAEVRRAVALLSKPSTERVPLAGSERRALLAVGSASRGYLVLRGLPPAPPGRAYEAWIVGSSGIPQPAALFSGTERLVALSKPVPPGAAVGVSVESEVGSDVPTERFRFVARRPAR